MSAAPEPAAGGRAGVLLALCATVVYVATGATSVLGGDNGEFATLFVEGGVAHPSGYSATVLWLRAWSWLPIDTPAQGAAVAMALLGGATVYGLWRACLHLGARPLGAGVATALFAFGPGAWSQATHAEVFAMHMAVGAGIVALSAPGAPWRGAWRVAALATLAGVGLANNHTIVGLAPIGLYGVGIGIRESRHRARAWAAGPAGFALGSLCQLQLFVSAAPGDGRWAWGDTSTWSGVVHHVLRRDFGTFQLGIYDGGEGLPLRQVILLGSTLAEHFLFVGLLVAVVGFGVVVSRGAADPDARRERLAWAMLGVSFLLVGPVLLSRFNLAPDGVAGRVVERFHLLPTLLMTPWVAVGCDRLTRRLDGRLPVMATIVAVAYVSIVARFDDVREHHRPTVELYLRNVVSSVPTGAVLLGTGDHRLYGFLYLERALSKMQGVTYVDVRMLLHPWYHDRMQSALGGPLDGVDHDARNVDTVALVRGLLAQDRDVYLTDMFSPRLAESVELAPFGALLEVRRPGAPRLALVEVAERHQAIMQRYVIESDPPHRDTWAALIHEDYARAWSSLSTPLRASGFSGAADTFEHNARRLRPVDPEPFWR